MTKEITEYEFHEAAAIFPPLEGDAFKQLKKDIKACGGLLQPIKLYQGKIVDGRNRYQACKELGIEPETEELDDPQGEEGIDLLAYVVSANLHRRHLDETQRAMVAARIATTKLGQNQHSGKGTPIGAASKMLNVG